MYFAVDVLIVVALFAINTLLDYTSDISLE